MRWHVEGADETTGTERRIVVDARDRDEAEHKARYGGLLVSSIEPDTTPPLDYAGPRRPGDDDAPVGRMLTPPTYRGILRLNTALRVIAALLLVMAVTCLAAAVMGYVAAARYAVGTDAMIAGATAAVLPASAGVFLLAAAAALRMLGEIARAVRDVARNSFNCEPGIDAEGPAGPPSPSPSPTVEKSS